MEIALVIFCFCVPTLQSVHVGSRAIFSNGLATQRFSAFTSEKYLSIHLLLDFNFSSWRQGLLRHCLVQFQPRPQLNIVCLLLSRRRLCLGPSLQLQPLPLLGPRAVTTECEPQTHQGGLAPAMVAELGLIHRVPTEKLVATVSAHANGPVP